MSDDDNPLAGGLQGLMQQATQMQQQVQAAQQRAAQRVVTGEAAGGLVTVEANGKMEITRVTIDPKVAGTEDLDMLQDLVVAATNAALSRARDLVKDELGPMARMLEMAGMGGLGS
jgi:DNA-binding YbaB/EbfC family protein